MGVASINHQANIIGDMSKLAAGCGSDINHRASKRGGRHTNVTEERFSVWCEYYAELLDPTPSAADLHIWSSHMYPTIWRLYWVNNVTGITLWEQPDFAKIERLTRAQIWEAKLDQTKSRLKTITETRPSQYTYDYGFVQCDSSSNSECHCRMRVRLWKALLNIRAGEAHSCYRLVQPSQNVLLVRCLQAEFYPVDLKLGALQSP